MQQPRDPKPPAMRKMLFALHGSTDLGSRIAAALGEKLAAHEERDFEDGEGKIRPLENVAGADVYVVHSLFGGPDRSANDKLCRLLFFIGALKDAGARRVTAVAPYLCYARKDRRTKAFDPVTTRYVASLFEAVGTDTIVTLDVHNPAAFENAFRCRTVALTAAPIFVDHLKEIGPGEICVVSPDAGGVKRAETVREALEARLQRPVGKAFVDKHRSGGVVSGDLFVGEAKGATAIIIDDLISSGTTLLRAAHAAKRAGVRNAIALVTHGLFMEGAEAAVADSAIERLIATDSVPPFRVKAGTARDKIAILPCGPLLAEAISRLHENEPLSDLLAF
jgi:ribose-phosphate pyrophosphokinase